MTEQRAEDVARRYGVAVRTVERWRAMGRRARRRAPVEDPAEMVEWWGLVSRRAAPRALVDAAVGGGGVVVVDAAAGGAVVEGMDLDAIERSDDLGVEVLAREVSAIALELRRARMSGDRSGIVAAQRQLREMSGALRQIERTREELSRRSGAVVAKSEVAAWIKRRETRLAQAFEVALGRAAARARDEGLVELRAIVEEERDRCFRALKDEVGVGG